MADTYGAARDFPENFIWGAVSCPACSEGETVSDWAGIKAPDGSGPDDGPQHWRRYRYDFRAMAGLGLTAYRFGCDWGRLQSVPNGPLDRDSSLRYLEMLAELRSLGIEPWLVLFQHALPPWAAAAGGWLNPETPYWFADFAGRLAEITDGEVARWLTIHEPQVYALSSYAWGRFPCGGYGRLDQVREALRNLYAGHKLAASALRRRLPDTLVGLSLSGGYFFPRRPWHPGDWLAARVSDWFLNRLGLRGFLKGNEGCDFLMIGTGNELDVAATDSLSVDSGVSATLPRRMRLHGGQGTQSVRRQRRLAYWLRTRRLPVYLVGTLCDPDPDRIRRILSTYAQSGAQMTPAGFFYDPLLDQFDPDTGLTVGRGLLRVDFLSRERHRDVREFARVFGGVAKSGCLGRDAEEERHDG